MGKERKKAGAAEGDKSNKKEETSAIPTIMRPIKKQRRKAMSRRIMREKKKRKGNWEI